MQDVLHSIWRGLAAVSALDLANLALGVVGVWLMIRRSLWAFPVGIAAVIVQGVLFYQTHFPADSVLQLFYLGSFIWGWWRWSRRRGAETELAVTTLTTRGRVITLLAASAMTAAWALTMGPLMHAIMPWRDAFIAVFSVAAQVLQVRKHIENWPVWIVVNLVAVASYWSADLAFTAALYVIYLVLAVVGWREWQRVK